jgi:hypothetical protein
MIYNNKNKKEEEEIESHTTDKYPNFNHKQRIPNFNYTLKTIKHKHPPKIFFLKKRQIPKLLPRQNEIDRRGI